MFGFDAETSSHVTGCRSLGAPTEWWTNFGQQVDRKPWGETIPCLTTRTTIYDTQRDRVLIGLELLGLHGFPATEIAETASDTQGFSDKDMARFAANGMSLPCLGTILFSYVLNSRGPWWKRPDGVHGHSVPSTGEEPKRRRRD
jgi:hypothetical protein